MNASLVIKDSFSRELNAFKAVFQDTTKMLTTFAKLVPALAELAQPSEPTYVLHVTYHSTC